MTSTTRVGESSIVASHTAAQRDFLLRRLMEDTQRMRGNGGDAKQSTVAAMTVPRSGNGQRRRKGSPMKNGTGSSSSTTAEDTDRTDSEENEDSLVKSDSRSTAASNFQQHRRQQAHKMFSGGLQFFSNPLHQYAATLAAAQFMQAAAGFPPVSGTQSAAASALPLLDQYPILYRSLFPFSNGISSGVAPSGIFPSPDSECAESGPKFISTPSKSSATPGATEKRMASISLASPKQTQSTPSPRKRPQSKIKESTKLHPPTTGSGAGTPKKARAIRRIQFDDEMCSPVSGMYIKDLDEMPVPSPNSQDDADAAQELLDDGAVWVKVTDEAKAELAKIPNIIGDYVCRLCKVRYSDAFQLAKHRCPRIAHAEYRCPECEKVFSCPANLASHRRWHKPKDFINAPDQRQDNGEHWSPESLEKLVVDSVEDSAEPLFTDDSPIDLSSNRHPSIPGCNGNGTTNGNGHGPADHESVDSDDDDSKSQAAQLIVSTPTYHECQTCGKRFDTHRWLRAHAVVHTNFNRTDSDENGGDHESVNGDVEVQCADGGCGLWFLSTDALEKHQRRAHPKFVCKFCSQSFPTSPALTRHINRQHPAPVGECRVILLPQSPPSRT